MNLSRGYLLGLVAAFALLSLQLVLPFLQYVLLGILIAYILYPLQVRLETYVPGAVAAMALVLLAIAGFLVPLVLVSATVVGDAAELLSNVDPEALRIEDVERELAEEFGVEVDVASTLADAAQRIGSVVLERSTEWFSALTHMLIGFGLAIFLVYYLLKDGDRLVAWIRERTPLPEDVQTDLYTELDEVMWAVLLGHVLIALVQGFVAGLGFFAVGIPNAGFWTFVMTVLALIPLVGAFLVWGPAVGYLFLTGQPVFAVALFLYSVVVVSISDDYLRPIVVDRYANLSPAVIIVGVLGGLYAYGVMGLFFGPVVLGALIATVDVVYEHYERLEGEEAGA